MIRQTGMALVSVLITLAVVSALTVQTVKKQSQQQELFALQLQKRQLWYQALGGEALAIQLLSADFRSAATRATDRFGEVWDIGAISQSDSAAPLVKVFDAQARLNPNSMLGGENTIDPRRLQLFQQAAAVDDIEPELMAELAEWIDADDELRLGGREASLFRRVKPPNLPMMTSSDIRAMPSYSPGSTMPSGIWLPLPQSTPININTAPREVLQRLRPGISETQVNIILRRQRAGGYPTKEAFLGASEGRGFASIGDMIDVRSSWFLVQVELEWVQGLMLFEALLHREPDSGSIRTHYRHWRAAAPTVRN